MSFLRLGAAIGSLFFRTGSSAARSGDAPPPAWRRAYAPRADCGNHVTMSAPDRDTPPGTPSAWPWASPGSASGSHRLPPTPGSAPSGMPGYGSRPGMGPQPGPGGPPGGPPGLPGGPPGPGRGPGGGRPRALLFAVGAFVLGGLLAGGVATAVVAGQDDEAPVVARPAILTPEGVMDIQAILDKVQESVVTIETSAATAGGVFEG